MKVSIAVIKLVLRTNKVLADGSHPIMLRVSFNGMKERSTGYSCTEKFWDKKNECIKKGYPNFVIVNSELKKQKDEAINKRDRYIASNEFYTPSMILLKEDVMDASTNDLNGLIDRYLEEKGMSGSSVNLWRGVKKNIGVFSNGRPLIINEINESFCRRYCRWLESKGFKEGSIRTYMSKIAAILHYAESLGLITYPLRGWNYGRLFNGSKSELYIHSSALDVMMDMFLDEVIVRDGGLWSYKEGAIERLLDVGSDTYAHYLYMVGYYLCGLAPVDISLLKKSDFKVVSIKGKSCYAIDGKRCKTSMPFRIRLLKGCIESQVLINTMLMFNDSEYFLPQFNGYRGHNLKYRIKDIYKSQSIKLVEWFGKVNEEIARRNVENGGKIELIDLNCRYYSYRHSYIMAQIQKPNVNLLRIATLTGKSVKTLHQYLALLNDLDLID